MAGGQSLFLRVRPDFIQVEALRRCRNHVLACFRHAPRVNATSLRKELVREVVSRYLLRLYKALLRLYKALLRLY